MTSGTEEKSWPPSSDKLEFGGWRWCPRCQMRVPNSHEHCPKCGKILEGECLECGKKEGGKG